jgi:ribonucleoside-diphosphate reductase alpha subunit
MRVASTLQQGDLTMIKKTYDLMSLGLYTHASPTMYNCGIIKKQLSSCFLLGTYDSLEEITKTWNSCAQISKWSGGIGLHVSNIRGKNSMINGTGGKSNGIVPFLRVFNDIARWIDQGGKRPGAIAIFLEPHHPDIFEFLDLRKNFGAETERARDLFLSLWISDLFMKQVDSDGDWYLMSADTCPGLPDVYGEQFEALYWSYVEQKKYIQVVKARKLWMAIMDAQIETGTPYIGFKDAINKKCNQKNLGTIKSSNLCHEITEYSDHNEYAVCNLGSIPINQCVIPFDTSKEFIVYTKPDCKYSMWAKLYMENTNIKYKEKQYNQDTLNELKKYVDNVTFPIIFTSEMKHIGGWADFYKYTASTYDYKKLYDIAYTATINLDKVIDINYYPVPQAKLSNMKHRPIGLGIQGLADALVQMRIPYESDEAVEYNAKIMETNIIQTNIPKLSSEQNSIVEQLENTNVIVDSVAGSGKTTTNLHIALKYSTYNILLLTYNAKLKIETRDRVKKFNIKNLEVHNYHSFCCKYYDSSCFNDTKLKGVISERKKLIKPNKFAFDMIILDEAQDINPLYYELFYLIYKENSKNAKKK